MAQLNTSNLTTTLNTNDANMSKILARNGIIITVMSIIILLNVLCFVTVLRDKNLKAKRFEMMTICLSISDILFGCVFFTATVRNLARIRVPYYCYVVYSMSQTTMTFSMLQMIMICTDLLLATFPTVRNPFLKIPVLPLNLILGVICLLLVFPVFALVSDVRALSCTIYDMAVNGLLFAYGVFQPFHLILIIAILISYSITIYRTFSSWKMVTSNRTFPISSKIKPANETREKTYDQTQKPCSSKALASTYIPQRSSSNKMRQMKQMAITLGLLVCVLLITWFPRVVIGHVFLMAPGQFNVDLDTVVAAEMMMTTSAFFNPLVYVLRIPRFREDLFRCCMKYKTRQIQETSKTQSSRATQNQKTSITQISGSLYFKEGNKI